MIYFKQNTVNIITPFNTGSGLLIEKSKLIVTNFHVVKGNKKVVVFNRYIRRQFYSVVYFDEKLDLALLIPFETFVRSKATNTLASELKTCDQPNPGDSVLALGFPVGLKLSITSGIISNITNTKDGVVYIQHDAALSPGSSGGPLVNAKNELLGINSFVFQEQDQLGFCIPIKHIINFINDYQYGQIGTKCKSCRNSIFQKNEIITYCPTCGEKVNIPNQETEYQPLGIELKIEKILISIGIDPELYRRGPSAWEIAQGSATIALAYHKKSGTIFADAYLCTLPSQNLEAFYRFLLEENANDTSLKLSLNEDSVILSMLEFDTYLKEELIRSSLSELLEKADFYDNYLIEKFQAKPYVQS